jgi:FHA domain
MQSFSTFNGLQIVDDVNESIKTKRDIGWKQLTNGIIDYSLKCLSGPHKNKFVYINLTPEGEIIGSDPQEATLYIESDEIYPKHAHITCRNGTYFLKDLSSKIGTWHRQGVFDWLPIEDKMEIKIFDNLFVFEYGGMYM